ALARKIIVDREGLVSGVSIIDRRTRKEEEIYARVIAVCCASVESARLLLNSACEKYPNGLANSSDQVGRYLGGHIITGANGYLKDLIRPAAVEADGMNDHAYIPRFNHLRGKHEYTGGYGMQLNYASWRWPHHATAIGGFGSSFKKRVREL